MITLIGGFRAPADQLRTVPGDAGGQEEYLLCIHICASPMSGATTNAAVYRRCILPDGTVAFRYAGLRYPVEGLSLEEVAR